MGLGKKRKAPSQPAGGMVERNTGLRVRGRHIISCIHCLAWQKLTRRLLSHMSVLTDHKIQQAISIVTLSLCWPVNHLLSNA